jgi:hypothetical protein
MRNTLTRLTPLRFFLIALVAVMFALLVASGLPHDRYAQFRSITDTAVVKTGWIYERIHFDPLPIDVVFIGTSHAVFGIDSEEVERTCRDAGGRTCASVNFALQNLGRNLHWLLAREVMKTRKPRLLVVEVQETEFRTLHPAFAYLADASDLISAPLVINTSFFPDLARLPLRQITLFIQSQVPSLFGGRTEFVPAFYRGPHWNDTLSEIGSLEHPIANPRPRTRVISVKELEIERSRVESDVDTNLHLPARLRPLEYRANLLYLGKMLNLARENGVEVRFLYIPTYHGPETPAFSDFYKKFAPIWFMPREIIDHHELWNDVGHLNHAGATALSEWLGAKIAKDEASSKSQ